MRSNDVMVSVIVLVYNHEKYIRQALNSILMQKTNFRYEVLIGDDASTDRSPEIVRHYQEWYPEKVHVFYSKENQGTTRNAYRLFTQAKGKYLASCESDDYWTDPYKLQKQVDFLENHPEYIGCTHKVQSVDENGRLLKQQKIWWISDRRVFHLKHFKGIRLPGHSGSVVRRNIFRDSKYDYSVFYQAHPFIGDRTSAMLFLAQGSFYQLSDTMSCFRRRVGVADGSLTQRLYQGNENRIMEELKFEHRLEEYARTVFNVDIGAEYYRRELFASAVWNWFLCRNANKWDVLLYAYRALEKPVCGCLLLPVQVVKKFVRKCILRNNQ